MNIIISLIILIIIVKTVIDNKIYITIYQATGNNINDQLLVSSEKKANGIKTINIL